MTLAAIVFIASMVIPLIKIVGIFWVGIALGRDTPPEHIRRGLAFLDRIGPWSMLDVFLLAVAISVVRFGDLTYIVPRAGIFAFAAVVVLTIIATQNLRAAADTHDTIRFELHVDRPYIHLLKNETKFWPTVALRADVGVLGAEFETGTLESFWSGGVTIATPPEATKIRDDTTYWLAPEPDDDWRAWIDERD